MATSYTERSLEWARTIEGWEVDKVERWIPNALLLEAGAHAMKGNLRGAHECISRMAMSRNPGVRKDAFGFIDLLALTGDRIVGIQSTSASQLSSHKIKIERECRHLAEMFCKSGGQLEIWGWKKYSDSEKIQNAEGKFVRRSWRPIIKSIEFS